MLQRNKYYKIVEFMYDGNYVNGWCGSNKNIPHNLFFLKDEFERILSIICGHKINTVCAARTDSGVHSSYNIFHFETYCNIDNFKLKKALNANLLNFVRVKTIIPTHIFFSARFWTQSREYQYLICNNDILNPLLYKKVCHIYKCTLNIPAMVEAQKSLLHINNIGGFVLKSFIGRLNRSILSVDYQASIIFGEEIHNFRFKAKSFAHHQIRIIMHFLIQVGINKLSLDHFRQIVSNNLNIQKILAPSHGLHLIGVHYIS